MRPAKLMWSGLLPIGCELIKSPAEGFATLIIDYNLTSGKTFNGAFASQAGRNRRRRSGDEILTRQITIASFVLAVLFAATGIVANAQNAANTQVPEVEDQAKIDIYTQVCK